MASLYPPGSIERRRFIECVESGRFYEAINAASARPRPDSERPKMKTSAFAQVMYGPYNPHFELWQAFQRLFPELAQIIAVKKLAGFNQFPIEMQRREAEIMIHTIVPLVAARLPSMVFLTIHDSLAISEEYQPICAELIREQFFAATRIRPSLKIVGPPGVLRPVA